MNDIHSDGLLVSSFYIDETLCGIDTLKIQEVVSLGQVTLVHHADDSIVGIINLRGKIVTIIDLAKKLGMSKRTATSSSLVYIIEAAGEHLGLLVDKVADVITAERENLSEPPENVDGVQARYIQAVCRTEHCLVSLLDVDAIVAAESSIAEHEA